MFIIQVEVLATYKHQRCSIRRKLKCTERRRSVFFLLKLWRKRGYALHRMAGVPISLLKVLKASAEIIAPALPAAAEIPWALARKRVGKTNIRVSTPPYNIQKFIITFSWVTLRDESKEEENVSSANGKPNWWDLHKWY